MLIIGSSLLVDESELLGELADPDRVEIDWLLNFSFGEEADRYYLGDIDAD